MGSSLGATIGSSGSGASADSPKELAMPAMELLTLPACLDFAPGLFPEFDFRGANLRAADHAPPPLLLLAAALAEEGAAEATF